MRISHKATIYIIDACNFSHAMFSSFLSSNRDMELEMIDWLKSASSFSNDEFVLYFDGYFRDLGQDTRNLRKIFCNDEIADLRIEEYALYCASLNKRAIVVTDDRELSRELAGSIKVISCKNFYSILNANT